MRIDIATPGPTGPLSVQLSHGRESSIWDVGAYARTSEKAAEIHTDRMFDEINEYWTTLPADRQKTIWDTYQLIQHVLQNNFEMATIQVKLQKLVKQLYDLMPLAEIRHWRAFHSKIRIPNNLKLEYDRDDPPDRTYLRSDYEELVVLAVALRPMVPIWGEYINSTRRETGSIFKEYMAMGLLYHSAIMLSVPMERLRVFVEAVVKHNMEQGPSATAVLGGLGSTELPDWVRALTVVRRLAVGEISAQVDASNIVTNVYQYISNTLKSMDRKFGGRFGGKVSEKIQPSGGNEEANASVVEMYKVKQEVSDGDLVIVNVYTEQVQAMAMKVDDSLDLAKLSDCLGHIKALENHSIQPHQVVLTQWVMAPCIPVRGIPLLTKPALLRAMATTQALLWHWGFFDLAVLATATPLPTMKDEMVAALESRGRIPKEIMDELQELYPHYPQQRGKANTVRQLNVAARAVDAFCHLVTRSDWQLHAPLNLLNQSSRQPNSKKLIVPADIRAHTARLVIHIAR